MSFNFNRIRLRDAAISSKILVPILAGFLLLVLTFALLINNLQQEKAAVLQNISSTQQVIFLADKLSDAQNQIQQSVISYQFSGNNEDLDEMSRLDAAMYASMDEMKKNLADGQSRQLLESYIREKQEAVEYRNSFIEAVKSGSPDKISQAYDAWGSKAEAVDSGLDRITGFSASMLNRDIDSFRKIITETVIIYLSILLITALLILLLYLYLREMIIKPIKHLTQGARHIAEGNLDWKIGIKSFDEIGELGQAFNEMTDKLKGSYVDLHVLAYSDPLTRLPNRQSLERELETAMAKARERQTLTAVLLIDLDRFKKINDTYGHDIGDKVLQEMASRLLSALRPGDIVVRLGGDEFIVILPDIGEVADASNVANRILLATSETMNILGHQLNVTCSLGIGFYPNDSESLVGLLKAADIALYEAKAGGRNRYYIYNKAVHLRLFEQTALENDLRDAIKNEQLKVYYQPLVNLQNGEAGGVEALLRWQHPSLGMLLPHEFIPLAEECGLINQIGPWVLKTACKAGNRWRKKGLLAGRLAVNLSARQFLEDGLVNNIGKILEETGFPPQLLALEITESLAMAKPESGRGKLEELSAMGIAIYIDDFGIGYSSLGYIQNFPVSKIKIDHSFVRQVVTEPRNTAIVKAVISMGHNMDMAVAAEGVESDTQLALLKSLGCDEAQGYYIARPMDGKDMAQWFLEHGTQAAKVSSQSSEDAGSVSNKNDGSVLP